MFYFKEFISEREVPTCDSCEGVVKPDVVFFGENLPSRFFRQIRKDFPNCDLLIIMVTPFFYILNFS